MIQDYVLELENDTDYVREHYDTFEEARHAFDKHKFDYTYADVKRRSLDPITLSDVYDHILTFEA